MSSLIKLIPKFYNVGIRSIPHTISIKSNINYQFREFARVKNAPTKKLDLKKVEVVKKVEKPEVPEYITGDEVFHTENDSIAEGGVSKRERHTSYKFVDRAQIEVKGGKGGNGCVSYEELSPGKKKPSGGNGGIGGNVYIIADKSLSSINFQTFHFNAEDGRHGGSAGLVGKSGRDIYISVPVGTIVTERLPDDLANMYDNLDDIDDDNDDDDAEDDESNEQNNNDEKDNDDFNEEDEKEDDYDEYDDNNSNGSKLEMPLIPTFNLDVDGAKVLVALGGHAGVGNASMAGSSTEKSKSLPATVIPGNQGVHRSLILELKLIADVGLVGFPNAGKSTLLRALSNAKPKVAPYPFTTLHPSVGVVEFSDLERITIADIPGLIDGASEDRGLGHDFLRHIERTKILLFVIDGVGSEGRDPCDDLKCLLNELELYNPEMLDKPSLVFSNKVDLNSLNISTGNDLLNDLKKNGKSTMKSRLLNLAKDTNLEVLSGSARKGIGMGELATKLRLMLIKETKRIEAVREEERLIALEKEMKRLEELSIKRKQRKYLGKGKGWK